MRIGILTFHWAANYGAVLQAFALQDYLRSEGHQVEIIDYRPARVVRGQILEWVVRGRQDLWRRELAIRRFRREALVVTAQEYRRSQDLWEEPDDFDVYICGSDQVWNEWFVRNAERTPTLTYYLDFVGRESRRVAYAASFGTERLSPLVSDLVQNELRAFSSIGVRETTGRVIVERLGMSAVVVVDPTLLLGRSVYDDLISATSGQGIGGVFPYVLHEGQDEAAAVLQCLGNLLGQDLAGQRRPRGAPSVSEWLARIRDAELVVTNSYHCVLFSIIFHTPFIALRVETGNMNDRLQTLLGALGLSDRIACDAECDTLRRMTEARIHWASVDSAVEQIRSGSVDFLRSALSSHPIASENLDREGHHASSGGATRMGMPRRSWCE